METEVAVSFIALRSQLENERSSLYKIDASIKKIVQNKGRFSDRFNNSSGDYNRPFARVNRNSQPDGNYNKNDELGKRRYETKTVFSRLSKAESDGEDEPTLGPKRSRVLSAVTRELPSRDEVVKAQGGDEQARTRNRRMFGSLLGTLHKFKQEEIVLKNKEEKKKQVEEKIEEQARVQKEREQQERKTLFQEREQKKVKIRALETKMARVEEYQQWETSQKSLGCFILTTAKPPVYWLPNKMSPAAQEKLDLHKKNHEEMMSRRREMLQSELERIQARADQRLHQKNHQQRVGEAREREEGGEGGGAVGGARDKFGERDHDSEDELHPHLDEPANGSIEPMDTNTALDDDTNTTAPGDVTNTTADESQVDLERTVSSDNGETELNNTSQCEESAEDHSQPPQDKHQDMEEPK